MVPDQIIIQRLCWSLEALASLVLWSSDTYLLVIESQSSETQQTKQ